MKLKSIILSLLLICVFIPTTSFAAEWTLQNPLPQDKNLYAVWGSSGNDIFAVGGDYGMPEIGYGTIVHYDGSNWSVMVSGEEALTLLDVWGSSGSDVFAVGEYGTILHYDGSGWSEMDSGTTAELRGVWGSSATDVFVVGYGYFEMENEGYGLEGTILHYDGASWSEVYRNYTTFFRAVWGSSGSDVFALSEDVILHYDGSAWAEMDTGTTTTLLGIWGSSATDVFAVGWDGTIIHFDGTAWSEISSGITKVLGGIWGTSGTDVYAVGGDYTYPSGPYTGYGPFGTILHYDGTGWSEVHNEEGNWLYGIWGNSDKDIFAVGDNGTILHYGCEGDTDCDGVPDDVDNCTDVSNPGQADEDFDGYGDVCDNCPTNCNYEQSDADGDGLGDVCDPTPGCGGCTGIQCEQECMIE